MDKWQKIVIFNRGRAHSFIKWVQIFIGNTMSYKYVKTKCNLDKKWALRNYRARTFEVEVFAHEKCCIFLPPQYFMAIIFESSIIIRITKCWHWYVYWRISYHICAFHTNMYSRKRGVGGEVEKCGFSMDNWQKIVIFNGGRAYYFIKWV